MGITVSTDLAIAFIQSLGIIMLNVIVPYWILLFFQWVLDKTT